MYLLLVELPNSCVHLKVNFFKFIYKLGWEVKYFIVKMQGCDLKGFCASQGENEKTSLLYVNTLIVKIFVLFLELSHLVQHGPTNEGVNVCWKAHCSELKFDMFVGLSIQFCDGEMSVSKRKKENCFQAALRYETASSKRNIWGVRVSQSSSVNLTSSHSSQTWL
jgi:hypothetical protein